MKKLGITTFNKLRKYETYLYTAHKADYVRGLTQTQLEELIALGKEFDIIYKNNHCPKCVLNFVKKLAAPYFELKQRMEDKRNAKNKEGDNQGAAKEDSKA